MSKTIIPSGVTFWFSVIPSISVRHQEGTKYFIKNKSGLSQYFKNIDVGFFDGSYMETGGRALKNDNLIGKQMLVKVFCPESIITIPVDKEEDYYKQIKEKYSSWIIDLLQNNQEVKYSAKLDHFLFTRPLIF
jgi:hypothetical protein